VLLSPELLFQIPAIFHEVISILLFAQTLFTCQAHRSKIYWTDKRSWPGKNRKKQFFIEHI